MSIWTTLKEELHLPNARMKITIGLAAFAFYLSIAIWLQYRYVPSPPPPPPPPGTVLELKPSFTFSIRGMVLPIQGKPRHSIARVIPSIPRTIALPCL